MPDAKPLDQLVAPLVLRFVPFRTGNPRLRKAGNDLAEYEGDLPVDRQDFDNRKCQKFVELSEVLINSGARMLAIPGSARLKWL